MPRRDDDERLTDAQNTVVRDLPQYANDIAGCRNEPCVATLTTDHDDARRAARRRSAASSCGALAAAFTPPLRSRSAMIPSAVASARENSATILPPRTTSTRCDMPEHFGQIARDHHDRGSARRATATSTCRFRLSPQRRCRASARRIKRRVHFRAATSPARPSAGCRPRACARSARHRACEYEAHAISVFVAARSRPRSMKRSAPTNSRRCASVVFSRTVIPSTSPWPLRSSVMNAMPACDRAVRAVHSTALAVDEIGRFAVRPRRRSRARSRCGPRRRGRASRRFRRRARRN